MPSTAPVDFSSHLESLQTAAKTTPFRVFLCGPKLSLHKTKPGAAVRKQIREALQKESFEVVLGEDEGLANDHIKRLAINAQDNELIYIKDQCNAVIIVAESVGSHCELGLFSWHFASKHGVLNNGLDLILLVDKKYRKHKSYFNIGPLQAVKGGKGVVKFVDFGSFNIAPIIQRLNDQRGITTADKALRRRKK